MVTISEGYPSFLILGKSSIILTMCRPRSNTPHEMSLHTNWISPGNKRGAHDPIFRIPVYTHAVFDEQYKTHPLRQFVTSGMDIGQVLERAPYPWAFSRRSEMSKRSRKLFESLIVYFSSLGGLDI